MSGDLYLNKLYSDIKNFVEVKLQYNESAHDIYHIERVVKLANRISSKENCKKDIVIIASLLHDISDWKFNNDFSEDAKNMLRTENISEEDIKHIFQIIDNISFKGGTNNHIMQTIEGKIVQDADRLDALGAIGIARTFAYGGFKKRPIHDPMKKPIQHTNFEEYKKYEGTSINHFYEKILLIKNNINTNEGKIIAEERHKFVETYLNQFFSEWSAEK